MNGRIDALAVFDSGSGPQLYAAGMFASIGSSMSPNVARFDGTRWQALDPAHPPTQGIITLAVFDDGLGTALFAIGTFHIAGIAATVARWNGTGWSSTGAGSGVYSGCVYDAGNGPRLYTLEGGSLGSDYLNSYDAVHGWVNVLNQSLYPFYDMAVGDLGAGPRMFVANGSVLSFDGTSFTGVPYPSQPTTTVTVFDDGSGPALYAAGVGVVGSSRVRRLTGSAWVDVGAPETTPSGGNGVTELAAHDFGNGPQLIAAGDFSSIGGVAASGIAVWDGATWASLGSGLSPLPGRAALASVDTGDGSGPSLFVSGDFTHAGGMPSQGIARFTGCGGPASLYCFGDGSAAACPCGNVSASGSQSGCLNSLGMGGTLRVHGQARLSQDTLVLEGAGMPSSSALYFQGLNLAAGGQGFQLGDGVKCVAGPFVRLGTKVNSGGASTYPATGDAPLTVKGAVTSAGTRRYQVHYRNSATFCTSATFYLTNGVEIQWAP